MGNNFFSSKSHRMAVAIKRKTGPFRMVVLLLGGDRDGTGVTFACVGYSLDCCGDMEVYLGHYGLPRGHWGNL